MKSKTILITFENGSVLEQDVEETSPLYERDSWSIHADPAHPKDDCRHVCDMRGTVACRVGCRFYGVYPTEQQAQEVRRG